MFDSFKRKIGRIVNRNQKSQNKWELFLSEKLGISTEEARKRLDFVRNNFGISGDQYCKRRYYELSETAMATMILKDNRRSAIRNERLSIMEDLSGKDRKKLLSELDQIKKTAGKDFINFRWYFDNGLYMFDPEEDKEKIKDLMDTGEEKLKLQKQIEKKFPELDRGEITYDDLESELSEYRALVESTLSEGRKKQLADLIKVVPGMADREDFNDILIDMEFTDRILDFSPSEYLAFHFWDKSIPERRSFVTSRLRNKVIRMLNTAEGIDLLDSKYDAYVRLAPFYRREMVLLDTENGLNEFLDFCSRHSVFVKKNNYESVGRGVQKIDLHAGSSPEEIYKSITKDGKKVILEELIDPSDEIIRLNPDSVNTVRIVVFADPEPKVQDSFMKVGRKGSFVDNGGAGGIFVHVDPETGVFDSSGIDEECFRFEDHPDHGYRFKGISLPEWDKAVETAKAASAEVPEAKYIGWDLTYTKNKEWIIVEGNSRTQFFGQQMTVDRGKKKEFLESVGIDEDAILKYGRASEIAGEIEESTGISADEILEKMSYAESLGIDAECFKQYRAWELTDGELAELKEALEKRKAIKSERKDTVASFIAQKTGISEESIKERYQIAMDNGYKEYWFIIDGIYLLSSDEIKAHKNLRETEFSDDWHDERGKRYREMRKGIRKEMSWNRAQYTLDFLKARNRCGCALDEYAIYGIWKMDEEEAGKLLTAGVKRNAWLRNATTYDRSRIFQDKIRFSEVFADYLNRACFTNTGLSYEDFQEKIKGIDRIVYKLREGEKGIGMETFYVNESEEKNREVYERLCRLGPGIVEEYLKQDGSIAEFYSGSVNTIRVITVLKDGQAHVVMAALRTGTSGTADNWSQGGVSASIDPESGIIESDGADFCGKRYIVHPVGKKQFRGFQIPHWDDVVRCCCKAAEMCPDMPFIGWDAAVLDDGRIALIEGNPDFGIKAVQTPCAIDGVGLKERLEKYF